MSGAKGHQTRPITNSSHYLFVKPPKMPKDMNYLFHLANIPDQGMQNAQRMRQLHSALRVTALHRQGTDGVMRRTRVRLMKVYSLTASPKTGI